MISVSPEIRCTAARRKRPGERAFPWLIKSHVPRYGFARAQTYIASGNVVFESKSSPAKVKSALEVRLLAYAGKPIGVVVRTASEMAAVVKANPFYEAHPTIPLRSFSIIHCIDTFWNMRSAQTTKGCGSEHARSSFYGSGMGKYKVEDISSHDRTARDMNTIAKTLLGRKTVTNRIKQPDTTISASARSRVAAWKGLRNLRRFHLGAG